MAGVDNDEADDEPAAAAPISRHPGGPAPLSYAQRQLYLVEQLFPGTGSYLVGLGVRLTGALQPEAAGAAGEAAAVEQLEDAAGGVVVVLADNVRVENARRRVERSAERRPVRPQRRTHAARKIGRAHV